MYLRIEEYIRKWQLTQSDRDGPVGSHHHAYVDILLEKSALSHLDEAITKTENNPPISFAVSLYKTIFKIQLQVCLFYVFWKYSLKIIDYVPSMSGHNKCKCAK